MHTDPLNQEDQDAIILDSRAGDLDSLKDIFTNLVHPKLLTTCYDSVSKSTPLHMAAANGHLEVIKYLLSIAEPSEVKQWVNTRNETGNTALHWASLNGNLEIVKLLCEEYDADQKPSTFKLFYYGDPAKNNGFDELERLREYAFYVRDIQPSWES